MGQLLDSAIEFLTDGRWRFTQSEDDNWVSLYYTGESGSWLSWFQDRGAALVAYAACPVKAPRDRWTAVSEVIGRANYGLGCGNFEMSFEDGAIRYKNGIYARDERVSATMIGHLFHITNSTMDDYLPAIMAVLYGDMSPELAVGRVEEALELRRLAVSLDTSTAVETPVDDEVAPGPDLINEELETLLATLSSGFGAQAESDNHRTAENRPGAELEDGTLAEHQEDAP